MPGICPLLQLLVAIQGTHFTLDFQALYVFCWLKVHVFYIILQWINNQFKVNLRCMPLVGLELMVPQFIAGAFTTPSNFRFPQ